MKQLFQTSYFVLLFLWVFFIPSSLAYHFNEAAGIVHGVLVDYRIPTIAASAIFFAAVLLFSVYWLQRVNIHSLLRVLSLSIGISFLFQIFVGAYQFLFQRSLFGYIPFGEVDFSVSQIVKEVNVFGEMHKVPYGTTAHPNILAGYSVVSFLILLLHKEHLAFHRYILPVFILLTILCILLTQSFSAGIALVFGMCMYVASKKKELKKTLAIVIILFSLMLTTWFFFVPTNGNGNPSIQRRAQLHQISIQMTRTHPLFGVGWNNFTAEMEKYGYVQSTVRFLQPVHNVFLLLIAEMGIIGFLICLAWIYLLLRLPAAYLPVFSAFSILGSLDHYLGTITTGRMLLFLVVFILFQSIRQRHSLSKVDRV